MKSYSVVELEVTSAAVTLRIMAFSFMFADPWVLARFANDDFFLNDNWSLNGSLFSWMLGVFLKYWLNRY